jgi:hypothetical protein
MTNEMTGENRYKNNHLLLPSKKVKVKFTLEQAMKAQRGSEVIPLVFL